MADAIHSEGFRAGDRYRTLGRTVSDYEILSFATADYLSHRLARYEMAGVTNVLLCANDMRVAPGASRIVGFRGRVRAAAILAAMERSP